MTVIGKSEAKMVMAVLPTHTQELPWLHGIHCQISAFW